MLKLSFILLTLASFSSTVFAGFTVMTYNVENLFNTTHDEVKMIGHISQRQVKVRVNRLLIADRKTVNGGRECRLRLESIESEKKMRNLSEVILYKNFLILQKSKI